MVDSLYISSFNKMKFLFRFIISVILVVSIIDIGFRIIITPLFINPPHNSKAGATYTFASNKTPAEIVILGASRASHHYVSQLIEDSLNVSVYNYGAAGRSIMYQYLCLINAINNGGLKTVVLDLSEAQLGDDWIYNRISDLYPYYWINDTVKNIVNEVKSRDMSAILLSSLIQYNSQYLNFIAPMPRSKGYIALPYSGNPIDTTCLRPIINSSNSKNDINTIAVFYLKKHKLLCKKNNIKFVVCLSPTFDVSDEGVSNLIKLCKSMNIECWNYTHLVDNLYFYSDNAHLNDKGAHHFTQEIIKKLRNENSNLK